LEQDKPMPTKDKANFWPAVHGCQSDDGLLDGDGFVWLHDWKLNLLFFIFYNDIGIELYESYHHIPL
jgi:hypothetical protein